MTRVMQTIWLCLFFTLISSTAQAKTYLVNKTADCAFPDGDNYCLRTAISAANDHVGVDFITVPEGVFTLEITGAGEDINLSGDLDINDSVFIIGDGPEKTIIDGGDIDRVFDVNDSSDITVVMVNLTIQGGKIASGTTEGGAGIFNRDHLILLNVVVKDNVVLGSGDYNNGGAILNHGSLEINDSTILSNYAKSGGGIFNAGSAQLEIRRSLISYNQAEMGGGGIVGWGTVLIENCTVHGNIATNGPSAVIIHNNANVNIIFSTITENVTINAFNAIRLAAGGTLALNSTILAGNEWQGEVGSRNCYIESSSTFSGAYNLEDANTCGFSLSTNKINTDPQLGPLKDNGGFTHTRALSSRSPAIDGVKTTITVTEDQRKKPRPQGSYADIGAYEYKPPLCFPIRSKNGQTIIICL